MNRGILDLTFFFTVNLVSNQDEWELFRLFGCSLVQEFRDPGLDVIEGLHREGLYLFIGDIVDKYAAVSATVEGSS